MRLEPLEGSQSKSNCFTAWLGWLREYVCMTVKTWMFLRVRVYQLAPRSTNHNTSGIRTKIGTTTTRLMISYVEYCDRQLILEISGFSLRLALLHFHFGYFCLNLWNIPKIWWVGFSAKYSPEPLWRLDARRDLLNMKWVHKFKPDSTIPKFDW